MKTQSKVLIIEDDMDLVEAIKAILEAKGMQVMAAYQPEEGLALAKTEKPDLIILDVMFDHDGHTEGFDLARRIRQEPDLARTPILMETAVNTEFPGFNFSAKDSDFLPVDDFINKPTKPDELVAKAEKLLEAGFSQLV